MLLLLLAAPALAAADESTPKTGKAAIASAHKLATDAGFEVIAQGGNAFDAAIAVAAALSVVEPHSSGIGGGGFFLLHRASDGKDTMIDARETAPAAVDPKKYLDAQGKLDADKARNGPLAAAIPDRGTTMSCRNLRHRRPAGRLSRTRLPVTAAEFPVRWTSRSPDRASPSCAGATPHHPDAWR
jgi:gamma-glutamyltranspeptidase